MGLGDMYFFLESVLDVFCAAVFEGVNVLRLVADSGCPRVKRHDERYAPIGRAILWQDSSEDQVRIG